MGAVIGLGSVAMADAPYITYKVVYDNHPVNNRVPVFADPASKGQVAFQVINNSSEAVYFEGNGVREYVPVISENTVIVPYDPNTRYRLVNKQDKEVLSWQLMSSQGQTSGVMNASAEQHAQWSSELQSIIRRNQNIVVQEYRQEESRPVRRSWPEPAPQQAPKVIRGFW